MPTANCRVHRRAFERGNHKVCVVYTGLMISSGDVLPNSLQHYFTAKCDFLTLRLSFKVSFYSLEYTLTRIPYIDFELKKVLLPPPPLGNFADISYLEENFKPHLLRDVCTLCSGALVSDSLLHMLL